MRDHTIFDDLHRTLFVRRTLRNSVFPSRLGRAVRSVVASYPSLRHLRFTITR